MHFHVFGNLDKPISSSPFRLTVASARTNLLLTVEATVRREGRPTSADPKPRLKQTETIHSFRGRAELWKKALSTALTEEQVTQYTEHTTNRLKTTVVDMMLAALQFDFDLDDSQLPAIRRRIEERVKVTPSTYRDIESTVGPELQRLRAEALGDILSEEQQFPAWSTKAGTVEVRGGRGKDRTALHVIYDVSTHPCDLSIRAFLRSSRSPGAAV